MARRPFEQIGLIPRSIIRTSDRFRKQLFKGGKAAVIQEFRVSRYQVIVSVKCLISLIFIPLVVNFLARTYFLKPLTEYLWNTQQTEIFLNVYQENRAFSELHDFEEKLFFQSLIETEPVSEQNHVQEKLETKKNGFGVFCFVNNNNEKNEKFYKTRVKDNKEVLHQLLPTPKTLKSGYKNDINDRFFLQTLYPFTNQTKKKILMSFDQSKTENNQQKANFIDLIDVDLFSINRSKKNEIQTARLSKNKNFSYKAEFLKQFQSNPCSSKKDLCSYKTNLLVGANHPVLFYHVNHKKSNQKFKYSFLCESEKSLKSKVVDTMHLENSLTQRFQQKTIELAIYYNQQSIQAIINFFGDLFTFFTIAFLFVCMEPQIIILKSFLLESIYSFSDTTKSFLLILLTDLLVGFHSPHGWEIFLEIILRHLGLPESQNFIFVFVATFPVLLDTLFKYWIFRYLNRISPSTVVTYHNMIE